MTMCSLLTVWVCNVVGVQRTFMYSTARRFGHRGKSVAQRQFRLVFIAKHTFTIYPKTNSRIEFHFSKLSYYYLSLYYHYIGRPLGHIMSNFPDTDRHNIHTDRIIFVMRIIYILYLESQYWIVVYLLYYIIFDRYFLFGPGGNFA